MNRKISFLRLVPNLPDQLQADPRSIYRVKVPNNGFFAKLDWTHAFSPTL
jgi:hypothetical protein